MQEFPINIDMYTTVIGLLLPILISAVCSPNWSKAIKGWISFGMVFLAAAGHLFFIGGFNLADFPATLLKILFLATGSYLSFWKPTGAKAFIEKNVGIKSKNGAAVALLVFFLITPYMFQGCFENTAIDWRNVETPVKRFHFAQLSFNDLQADYISMFPRQPEETKDYLRKNVAPVMHKAKIALDLWEEVVMEGAINTGQESKFTLLFDELALLLKPYIVKKE